MNFLLWLSYPAGSKFNIELIIIASDKYSALCPSEPETVKFALVPDSSGGTGPCAADNAPTFDKKLS
jgi:hypothetical protein